MTYISRKRRQFIIFLFDVLFLYISIPITLLVRNLEIPTCTLILTHASSFTLIVIFWEVMMYGSGLYSLEHPFTVIQTAGKLVIIAGVSLLFGFALFYLLLSDIITPKTVLVLYSGISFFLLLLWRSCYNYFFGIRKQKPRVAFIGFNETVETLIHEMKDSSYFGFTPVLIYDTDASCNPDKNTEAAKVLCISDTDACISWFKNHYVDIIIIVGEKSYPIEIRQQLFLMLSGNIVFYNLPDFFELVTRKIPIGSINDNWLLSHLNTNSRTLFAVVKRLCDLLFSTILLLLSVIFGPILALLIKIETPGPIFFRQIREGRNGKVFLILKFRTMRVEGNTYAPTDERDSRITKIGNFLRKTRLDEIPQIFNVFKGDMSLIGPRPERPEIAIDLEKTIPYYRQRLIVKPGITGWDQVSGEYHSPSIDDTYKKLQYDLYYIKNRSIFLDVSIIFKTVSTVLKRRGR